MFLTAFSIRVSLLSSKIHNGDDTPKGGLSFSRFPRQKTVGISVSPHACYMPANIILLDLNTLIMFGEKYIGYHKGETKHTDTNISGVYFFC